MQILAFNLHNWVYIAYNTECFKDKFRFKFALGAHDNLHSIARTQL